MCFRSKVAANEPGPEIGIRKFICFAFQPDILLFSKEPVFWRVAALKDHHQHRRTGCQMKGEKFLERIFFIYLLLFIDRKNSL